MYIEMDPDTCVWTLIGDSLKNPEIVMPREMNLLYHYMRGAEEFVGSNTDLAEQISDNLSPKGFKQMMNRWRYKLEELGVFFESKRSNGQKYVVVRYRPELTYNDSAASASSDALSSAVSFSVSCAPCVPTCK